MDVMWCTAADVGFVNICGLDVHSADPPTAIVSAVMAFHMSSNKAPHLQRFSTYLLTGGALLLLTSPAACASLLAGVLVGEASAFLVLSAYLWGHQEFDEEMENAYTCSRFVGPPRSSPTFSIGQSCRPTSSRFHRTNPLSFVPSAARHSSLCAILCMASP